MIQRRERDLLPLKEKIANISIAVENFKLEHNSTGAAEHLEQGVQPTAKPLTILTTISSREELRSILAESSNLDPVEAEMHKARDQCKSLQKQKDQLMADLLAAQQHQLLEAEEVIEQLKTAWACEREAFIEAINEMHATELEYLERIADLEERLAAAAGDEAQAPVDPERVQLLRENSPLQERRLRLSSLTVGTAWRVRSALTNVVGRL